VTNYPTPGLGLPPVTKDVMPDTNVLSARPPRNPTLVKLLHDSTAAGTYTLLLVALAGAIGLVTTTPLNMLPGIVPFEAPRAAVISTSAGIVVTLIGAFFFECAEHGLRGAIQTLALRSRRLPGLLGLRRSPHQTLTAIWLGLAGGALAYGLQLLLLATVTFPAITQPDARIVAIGNLTPIAGGAYLALYSAPWEEAVWRGALLLAVAGVAFRWRNSRAQITTTVVLLVVTSASFGYIHLDWSLANAVVAGTSGLIFGAIALHQKSLWPAVIAHATLNFTVGFIALT
jgi:membrane protease YdiL (CAAX protease family)